MRELAALGAVIWLGACGLVAAGTPRDTDLDGVRDREDACQETPARAVVDPRGCPADSDGDRVLNGLDACPNTAATVMIDSLGCPLDSDADGVYDGSDQCPATAAGVGVDGRGCPLDGDGDTVSDDLDACPATPAGTAVDARGCPAPRDTDGDGVDDSRDRCAQTTAGTAVDSLGCHLLFAPERAALVLRGVTFETGAATLQPRSHVTLDEVAASLLAHPDVRIEIAGHTDHVGSDHANQRLSQARADAVLRYLAARGVAHDRMTARGYGERVPVAANATAAGRADNRRVELRRLPAAQAF